MLLAKIAGSRLSLPWLQPRPPSKNRAHLPLDALPHSLLFLLGTDGLDPLPATSQHRLAEFYPEPPEFCPEPPEERSCPQLRWWCRDLLMEEWNAQAPDLARYPYPPSLKPHPFMGLTKFNTGWLHQIRSGKSYLGAHPSWDNCDPTTCPRCDKSPETFEHAVLSCPAREPARVRHLQAVSSLGHNAPVWSSATLLGSLSPFTRSTQTAFPLGMFSCPSSATGSVSSHFSNVVSFGYFISSQESYVISFVFYFQIACCFHWL